MNTRRYIPVLALVAVAACQPKAEKQEETAAAPATPAASVEIVEPAAGATVTSPVKFVLKATGIEIAPAADEREGVGHFHLFVDKDLTAAADTMPRGVTGIIHMGNGKSEFTDSTKSIKAGHHRVILVVGDHHHTALTPLHTDTVEFDVK